MATTNVSKVEKIATDKGVWKEIQMRFPGLTQKQQYMQFKMRLGRIFENAALEAIDRPKNTKRYYSNPLDKSSYVLPITVAESGITEDRPDKYGNSLFLVVRRCFYRCENFRVKIY